MRRLGIVAASAASIGALLALSGCGREADRASRPEAASVSVASTTDGQDRAPRRASATHRSRDGAQLVWAASRRRSAEDSAQRQFDRNGADFGASTVEDYAAKAHAFVAAPPKGVQTLARNNGDVLYYDAKANVFAVADRDGVPKAMFKPRDGKAYWAQQTQALAEDRSGRSGDRRRGGDNAADG